MATTFLLSKYSIRINIYYTSTWRTKLADKFRPFFPALGIEYKYIQRREMINSQGVNVITFNAGADISVAL